MIRCYLLAVDETVILLHPPVPLVGVSIVMERERSKMTVSSVATVSPLIRLRHRYLHSLKRPAICYESARTDRTEHD